MRSAPRPAPTVSCRPIEPLERRSLLSVSVQIDYSLDANNFFSDPIRRQLLQAAADDAVALFGDHLDSITPGSGNTWTAVVDNPATGRNRDVNNLSIPADTILVYAGGREMSALGVGGPGGYNAVGSSAWRDRVAGRGQGDAEGDDADDFGPWGGSISFDSSPSGGWFFGTDADNIPDNATDFYSVALHEVLHVLGFGTADSWERLVNESDATFTGPAATAEYDGAAAVPLNPEEQRPSPQPDIPADTSHWKSGLEDGGHETAMDPELTSGMRKHLTALDIAGLDDIGWEIPLTVASFTTPANVMALGATSPTFTITYSHYTDIDAATIDGSDVTISGPDGFTAPATLVSIDGAGRTVTATYAVDAPGGGTFDRDDSGAYTLSLNDGAVGDSFGNFARPRELGSFEVDIDSPPVATLAQEGDKPAGGAATYTLSVAYEDIQGIDATSVNPANITVTRAGDGLTLNVKSVEFTPDAGGGTATYTVEAPGGTWDTNDNGAYTVALNPDQVRDQSDVVTPAATLGSFEVALGTIEFSQGKPATFTDADGDTVLVTLSGPGTGRLLFDNADGATSNLDASRVVLAGTSGSTSLTITASGNGTSLGGLDADGSLKSITAKNTDLAGAMAVTGVVPKIQFRNASGSITLNGIGAPATIVLAQARDLSVTSVSQIKSLKVTDWLDTDGVDDVITTPALTSLAASGTLQAHVAAGSVGKVTAGGALDGAEIRAAGSIGSVTAASATDSLVYAGVRPDVSDLPDSLDDFANQAASIKSFMLKGKSASFSNTRIAAPFVGKAALGVAPLGTGAGNIYGLAADRITSVTGATPKGAFRLSKRNEPGSGTATDDFAVVVL
jgi:hypothetical protein